MNQWITVETKRKIIDLRGLATGAAAPPPPPPAPAFKSRKIATARLLAILPNVAN